MVLLIGQADLAILDHQLANRELLFRTGR